VANLACDLGDTRVPTSWLPAKMSPGPKLLRCSRGPRLGIIRCVGQALAPEAIAECIRSGGVWEAESNIDLLDLVPTPAAADWDASFTVERINLSHQSLVRHCESLPAKCEFDQMREVLFVPKADHLALATSHLVQSSSALRFTAGAAAFFILSQSGGPSIKKLLL